MNSTVKAIITGYSNSALRCPFAYAQLDCGHSAEVKCVPYEGECMNCGQRAIAPSGKPCANCGGMSYRIIFTPDYHNEAHRLTKVGDQIACGECDKHAERIAWLKTLNPKTVHHARFRPRHSGGGYYTLYTLDATSPSNFMSIGGIEATPEVDALLDAMRVAALSPTEPA